MCFNPRLFSVFILSLFSMVCLGQELDHEKKDRDLKILVISDLNDAYGSVTYSTEVHRLMGRIKDINPDIILCGGDMVAGQKASLRRSQLDSMWSGFHASVLEPIQQMNIPFGFTMGNHDASPNYKNDREAASAFWMTYKDQAKLTFVDDTHFPYYFSYLKNNILFLSWDASSSVIPDAVKSWMQTQLTSAYAQKARGRIVLGHLPLYALVESKNKPGEVIDDADATLAFFREYRVDMYISGHQHAYFPGSKQQVTLLHSGCLGGGPRPLLGHDVPAYKSYAIIDIPKKGGMSKASILGFVAPDDRKVPLNTLPREITGFNGTVKRIDRSLNGEKLTLPKLSKNALPARHIVQQLSDLDNEQREKAIADIFLRGNFPKFMRKLKRIDVAGLDEKGNRIDAYYYVMPDYLMLGTDTDFVRLPIRPSTAQYIADSLGFVLSNSKICDAVYQQAKVKLEPLPLTEDREQFNTFVAHNARIEQQRQGRKGLIAGIKKDVVSTEKLRATKGKLALYGWHKLDGKPIQPVFTGHADYYVDYSHGIRFVYPYLFVGKQKIAFDDALMNSSLRVMLTDENASSYYNYPW
ncbi:metallophosphoesterase family protein [Sphingobacterium faecale]|uniref:Metallophosphoesterase n=1 Tax=Sphingobacterium faecale TaxID=2803775 RepID=A0ABS1R0E1_9SPHI|nr:metallophosphoesterase [Sphingobacterium faecale]MBL1407366.1 metallophosphoesterase [Sphingobacterium faecale]